VLSIQFKGYQYLKNGQEIISAMLILVKGLVKNTVQKASGFIAQFFIIPSRNNI
jgi:hypothetical protein